MNPIELNTRATKQEREARDLAPFAMQFQSRTWTAPTLADGILYLRDEQELVALKITEP